MVSNSKKISWLGLAVLPSLIACGARPTEDSDLSQLTPREFKCVDWPQARVGALQGRLPEGFIKNWQDQGSIPILMNLMAGLPDQYMDFFIAQSNQGRFYVTQRQLGGSTTGLTSWGGSSGSVALAPSAFAVRQATQHEFGHAVQFIYKGGPKISDSELGQYLAEGKASGKLRGYAQSSVREYFAEAFNNFYCSQEAHNFIQSNLPQTYAYLRTKLLPPVWEVAANTTPAVSMSAGSVFVLLQSVGEPGARSAALTVSAPAQVAGIAGCFGTVAQCTAAPREDVIFTRLQAIGGTSAQRAFFRNTAAIDLATRPQLTLLSLDASRKVISARAVGFKQK